MPHLEWDKFAQLSGDTRSNWELLCREVVRRHYERFGPLFTRKQQPGVEFHIAVERDDCELGEAGRHWGWQCKWYDREALRQDESLRAGQRREIEDAIEKSVRHVDGLTDWVLWTKGKFTADDDRWFAGLDTPLTLHRWDEETLIGLLSGPAEILLKTWFGELVLDRTALTARRREALAPIQQRYVEELHLRTPMELEAEGLLLGSQMKNLIWDMEETLARAGDDVEAVADEAQSSSTDRLYQQIRPALAGLRDQVCRLGLSLEANEFPSAEEVEAVINLDEIEGLEAAVKHSHPVMRSSVRALQAVHKDLDRIAAGLRVPMLGVLGGAGSGKTHMAASLTGPDEAARGVLVLGGQFGAHIDDDDLARFSGLCSTRDELLEALDALGMREKRRVPLVIDGINESDDPSAWHVVLSRLHARLTELTHVFVVVTSRPTYRSLALPPNLPTVELPGLSGLEEEAVERYFTYYKIDATSDALHWWRPSDPLLLSIFCRTVNPERKVRVRRAEVPGSLTEVFEAHLDAICIRIATTMKIPTEDVATAILNLAEQCFLVGGSQFDRELVAEALGDSGRPKWNESLRFQLEAEEVLIRDVINDRERIAWSYDLLGGHVLAKSLLRRFEPSELAAEEISAALEAHPLSEDIFSGLAGILGARGQDLAAVFDSRPQLAAEAALASARLPASQVGEAAVSAIRRLFSERPEDVLEAISNTALHRDHPMNGRLLDSLLAHLEVWRRDLTWTEWMQERSGTIMQVGRLSQEWRAGNESTDDEVAIIWLSWVLTATDREVRDSAIQALYRVGRRRPEMLFARTLQMLDTNDPAVPEGLMAASYGAVMASQDPSYSAEEEVVEFAAALRDRLLRETASQPTFHWLIREYAYRIAQFAVWISGGKFTAPSKAAQPPFPRPRVDVPVFQVGDEGWLRTEGAPWVGQVENAVRALPARDDPQELIPRFREIDGEIRARVADLGWSEDRFGKPFDAASEDLPSADESRRGARFGEKYSSTAFYEAVGRLSDRGELRTRPRWRLPDLPIDPSFPESAVLVRELPSWIGAGGNEVDWNDWALDSRDQFPGRLIYRPNLPGKVPWVAVNGYLWQQQWDARQTVSCAIRGFLALDGLSSMKQFSSSRGTHGDFLPDDPVENSCFAGEAPWSPTFDSDATDAAGRFEPQVRSLGGITRDEKTNVELLSVTLKWGGDRSPLNTVEAGPFPGKSFSRYASIRKVADRPEFVDAVGRPAAISVSPKGIDGWSGAILYVREDLLQSYCSERGGQWGWLAWAEQQLLQPSDPEVAVVSSPKIHRRFLGMAGLDDFS